MSTSEALGIVLELAEGGALKPVDADSVELCQEVARQAEALEIVTAWGRGLPCS